jgi:hypothetical protein
MNRYLITAKDGRKFQYEALTPMPAQPEWGKDPEIVVVDIKAESDQEAQKKNDKAQAHARMKAFDLTKNPSAAEQVQILKDLVTLLVK